MDKNALYKISIIIPIYNAEKFIARCIESLLQQTLTEIEIICINDGSTDNSLNILESYKKNDSRIKIINKENDGVSAARNKGIIESTSKYIMFVDADDYVLPKMCQKLYEYAEKSDTDIVQCQHINLVYGQIKLLSDKPVSKKAHFLYDNIKQDFQINDYIFCWDKLYKRDFIIKNKIEFPIGQKFAEDFIFVINAYIMNPKILIIKDYLYIHNINAFSTCNTTDLYDMFSSIKNINIFLKDKLYPLNSELYVQAMNLIFYNILRLWQPLCYGEYRKQYLNKVNEILNELNNNSNLSSMKLAKRYLFFENHNLTHLYWKYFYYIERYFVKFFIKQLIIKFKYLAKNIVERSNISEN